MQSKSLEANGYSESIVSGRLQDCMARLAREDLVGPVTSLIHKM